MQERRKLDWSVMLLPLGIVLILCAFLMGFPAQSKLIIESLRRFVSQYFGWYYIVIGLGFFLLSMYVALGKRGNIRLGDAAKPKYSHFSWASMVFTATMAADILFFALHEWMYYYTTLPLDFTSLSLAQKHLWASSYPLFHWGPIPWSFFILPSAAYGYMFFVQKRSRQRLSEASRPVIGKHADGPLGKAIDIFASFGLLAGAATTFSLATPLITLALNAVFGLPQNKVVTIAVLIIIAVVYTLAVVFSFKGIAYVAELCVWFYLALIALFLLGGNVIHTVETAITAIGNVANNFLRMATWLDPLRSTVDASGMSFPQSWTIFYWAYWIAWCVATPFFIGRISEGRSIRQVILGGFAAGLGGTYASFSIFGGFGLGLQATGRIAVAEKLASGASQSEVILDIFRMLPFPRIALVILVIAMVLFYASTFDALTMVMATYSYRDDDKEQEPSRGMKTYWSLLFVLLPVALLFSEQALSQLQTVSILAALPISFILILVVISFLKTSKGAK